MLVFPAFVLACHSASAPRERAPDAAVAADPPAASVLLSAPVVASSSAGPTPADAAAPASSSAPVAAASSGQPGLCFVEITASLSAQIFRGVPRSPSRDAARARLSPETRQRWDGRDHGLSYLECRYAVRMNGRPFTYAHIAGQGLGSQGGLDAKTCTTPSERSKVAARIVETTKKCTEPHAGAYWGFDLVETSP